MKTLFFLFIIATLLAMLGCASHAPIEESDQAPLCSVEQTDSFFTSVMTEDDGVQVIEFLSQDFESSHHCSLGSI